MVPSLSIRLRADDVTTESAVVEPLAAGRFRLLQTPILAFREETPAYAGDIVELHPESDGSYRLGEVVTPAPMQHSSWIVPHAFVKSPEYRRFGAAVEEAGGYWEGALGGLLWAHVPTDSPFDADAALAARISAAVETAARDGEV
jgi:hypothetical protein